MLLHQTYSTLKRKDTKALRYILILFGLIACLGRVASASQPVPVLTGEWVPYTGEHLPQKGFFTALVQAAMDAASLNMHLSFYPWTRGQFLIESGEAFATFPYVITAERLQYCYYSDPIYYDNVYFFYKPALHPHVHFDSLEDLKNYRIGGAKGFYYEERFKAARIPVTYMHNEKDLVKLLELDHLDMVPMNEFVGWEYIRTLYPEKAHEFATLPKPYSQDGLYLMVSKRYPESEDLLKRFNQGLLKIKRDGTYDKILKELGPLDR